MVQSRRVSDFGGAAWELGARRRASELQRHD